MSWIVDFYREEVGDKKGRYLYHILGLPNYQLEHSHDLIQLVFPTTEPSHFNPDAPILTEEDIAIFKADPKLQDNLRWAYSRFLGFLGLTVKDGKVIKAENFQDRYEDCWAMWNHNFLRITRAISCLRTLGLAAEAWALYEGCMEIANDNGEVFMDSTLEFWKAAVTGKPFPKYGG